MADPIKKTYDLTAQLNVVTTITGDNKDNVLIEINDINTLLWSGAMIKTTPPLVTPNDLTVGDTTLKGGASFHLTCPSKFQKGQVLLSCKMKSGDNPYSDFSAVVATWTLS